MLIAIGLLLLRLAPGLIFLLHGAQKLFGVFGGHGLGGTTQFMNMLGLRPAKWWATIAAWGEFVGGLLLVLGLFTPLAALLVLAVMLVAILKVHASKGFWNSQGGYEYNLVLSALATVLGLVGAGAFSLDALLGLSALSPNLFLLGLPLLILLGVLVHQPTSAWFQKRWHSSHV
jgi:putative oxidoreductase